jgi:hypothetical protein
MLTQTPSLGQGIIDEAIDEIIATGKNRIICSRTGDDIGNIDSAEIRAALEIDYRREMPASADRLVDLWELRYWILASRPAPAFHLMDENTLATFLRPAPNSEKRLLTFELTRLIYPSEPYNSQERFWFMRAIHESLSNTPTLPETGPVAETLRVLLTLDSLHDVERFHRISTWRNRFSKQLGKIKRMPEDDSWSWEQIFFFVSDAMDYAIEWLESNAAGSGLYPGGDAGNRLITNAMLAHLSRAPNVDSSPIKREQAFIHGLIEVPKDQQHQLKADAFKARAALGLKQSIETSQESFVRNARAGDRIVSDGAQHTNDSILRMERDYIDKGLPVPTTIAAKASRIRMLRYGTENKPKARSESNVNIKKAYKSYDRASLESSFASMMAAFKAKKG